MLFNDLDYGVFGLEMPRNNLYSPEEGLQRGNLFPDLYKPYKNYSMLKVVPKNEKETLLLKIYALDFAINDLNLYLDIYPQEQKKYLLFKDYVKESEKLKKEYETKFGPLCLTDVNSMQYVWYKNPWPWESEDVKYV